MSHANRGRVEVELSDSFRGYAKAFPQFESLGLVRFRGQWGLLLRKKDGTYQMMRWGEFLDLPTAKVEAAIEKKLT